MRWLNRWRRLREDEQGMTLIELLTALVILAMVTTILFSFLLMGVSMFKRISAESQIRNQGDALTSRIMAELKDAVYVVKSGDASEIEYAKREAAGADAYVSRFTMKLIGSGVEVRETSPAGQKSKQFTLASAYELNLGQSSLSAPDIRTVKINLVYRKKSAGPPSAPLENPTYQMTTQIPLVRSEGRGN